jgi:type IV secretion system protein VirB11
VETPIVEGELPLDGSRFEGVIPPIVSQASFTIRKKAGRVFTLEEYAAAGTMPSGLAEQIKASIVRRDNILVAGGTGSGKTTLVNAIILAVSQLCPDQRLVIMEDTMELQSKSRNTVFFRTSEYVNMTRLLKMTMRYRPDRIIIGEVRDQAALDLLKAWNTGHPGGVATIHANSAEEGLDRLEELTEEAGTGPKQKLIGRAVDLIIFIRRAPGGRKVTQAIAVNGFNQALKAYNTQEIYVAD